MTVPSENAGDRIGPYKLLEKLGEGGMGTVWMAEQREPIRRLVALKLIKPGMDSGQVLGRFEAERQALALMDHPNIARVLDAGATSEGRPYFVMELVKGVPMTKFCDEQRLSIRERLELFLPVCQAIQHAHQKAIIHRDISPSNVLVALYDGVPVPKVIDFGIAKAMGQQLTERTLFTGFGAVIGKLEYMSPEQAEFNQLDIDTRSDLYGLGVLLYELLTGTTPLTREALREAALEEVLRRIREQEPPKPSTRLSESKDRLASISVQRKLDPAHLTKLLRGDLDWIVMKSLEKDRNRRYASASGLAQDILNHLSDEPVSARPPSASYRVRKFVRKHRFAVAWATAVAIGLAAASVVSIALAAWANREKSKAVKAEKEALSVLSYFQDTVLAAARPEGEDGGLGHDVTLRAAVAAAEPAISKSFAGKPLVEASIRETMGNTYAYLGEYTNAIPQHERALALRRFHLGSNSPYTISSAHSLGVSYRLAGRVSEAIPLFEEALKQPQKALGDNWHSVLENLGIAYIDAGRADKAVPLLEDVLSVRKSTLGPDDPKTLTSMNSLAGAYRDMGRMKEALSLFEQTLKLRQTKLGMDHLRTLSSMNNLGNAYRIAGRPNDAVPLLAETLKLRQAKLGQDHPDTLGTMLRLAMAYHTAGKLREALSLYEQTLKLSKVKLGPDHPDTLGCMNGLALAYREDGRKEEAIELSEETLKLRQIKLGPDHPETLISMNNLALARQTAGRAEDALPLYEEALRIQKAKLGLDHPETLTSMHNLASVYHTVRRTNDSLALYEETLKLRRATLGANHPNTLLTMHSLAWTYAQANQFEKAWPLFDEAIRLGRDRLGPEHPLFSTFLKNTAEAYEVANRRAEAIRLWEQLIPLLKSRLGETNSQVAEGFVHLGSLFLAAGEPLKAEPQLRGALRILEERYAGRSPTLNAQSLLGAILLAQARHAEAEPLLVRAYEGLQRRQAEQTARSYNQPLRETCERLVRLYDAWGKPDQAAEWRKKLDEPSVASRVPAPASKQPSGPAQP
jgi:serine/threonine protein kinase